MEAAQGIHTSEEISEKHWNPVAVSILVHNTRAPDEFPDMPIRKTREVPGGAKFPLVKVSIPPERPAGDIR